MKITKIEGRVHALDGLRGYAAFVVIFFHSITQFLALRPEGHRVVDMLWPSVWNVPREDVIGRIILAALNGQTAVTIFFAISGAVLIRSIRAGTLREWLALPFTFAARRVLRIFPALIVCLAGFYVLGNLLHDWRPNWYGGFAPRAFIENATLHRMTIHGPTWTLQAEMLAIPFILLAFALKRSFGVFGLVLVLGYSLLVREDTALSFGSATAFVWMPYFAAGMLAEYFAKSTTMETLTSNGKWAVVLFVFVFITTITSPAYLAPPIVQCGAAFLIIGHVMGPQESAFKRFLCRPVSQYLGRISYSLYLWNVPFLYFFLSPFTDPKYGTHYLFWGCVAGCAISAVTIPVAHVSERYLERSYKWFARRKGGALAAR